MAGPDRTADLLALRALVEQYARGADQRDADLFAAVFTDDGFLLTSSGREFRHPELGALATALIAFRATMHLVGNHHVTFAGDDVAHGEVYCRASHVRAVDGVDWDHVMVIIYHDDYVRRPDGWRIAKRFVDMRWTEDHVLHEPGAPGWP